MGGKNNIAAGLLGLVLGLLLAAWPVAAQEADPFREDAPPASVTPGHDSFQMAPADPASAARPVPHREAPPVPPDPDLILWQTIQGSSNPYDFQTYLRLFPTGRFVNDANARLAALRAPLPAGAPPASAIDGHYRVRTEIVILGTAYCTSPNFSINVTDNQVDVLNRKQGGQPVILRGPMNGNSFDIFAPTASGGVRVKGTINGGQVVAFDYLASGCRFHYP